MTERFGTRIELNFIPSKRAKFMMQAAVLGGFGSEMFSSCVQNIKIIHGIFARQLDKDALIPWDSNTYLQWQSISPSNRYFTSNKNRSYLEAVPFERTEDPDGNLTNMRGNGLVHCEDNVVTYLALNGQGR